MVQVTSNLVSIFRWNQFFHPINRENQFKTRFGKVIAVVFFLLGAGIGSAFEASAVSYDYEVTAQIYVKGKIVAEPVFYTMSGEVSELIQSSKAIKKRLRFSVVATEKEHVNIKDGIHLQMEVDYKLGEHIVQSKPEVLIQSGKEAKISQSGKDGKEQLMIKISAKRR